ncbi:AAA family ATPase [Mycobacteroides abscessus]|uniref:AAA family ATPase n=1 Tax=Mycobacteroides abscessus TaxID=36809 RepID=UPI0009A5C690|nr:AAA family ATPase [Mycobacteroides abscessus]
MGTSDDHVRTGRTILTGEAGSGKTTMLRDVLLRLTADYSPSQLRIVFGAGRYSPLAAELAALPHTIGAYHGLAEDPFPFVKRLRRERDRRRRRVRAGLRQGLPQLLIVLDDFDSIGQMRKDLRRLLERIWPWWHDEKVTILMAMRAIDPHTDQAGFFYPHRIHFGGTDGIDEFPEAMQEWTNQTADDQSVLWSTRARDRHLRVFAEENSDDTVAAICGAVGLPVTTAGTRHASQDADSPWGADSLPHGAFIREAHIGDVAIRAVHAHSTNPDWALNQTRFPQPVGAQIAVDAVWIGGLHRSGEYALTGNGEFVVRVNAEGADLDIARIEAAIRSVDPATRYVDSARYAALWQEVTDQLRGLDVDEQTRKHPVTQLAQEFGWRLSGSAGPGRPHYVGPNGEQMAALLAFDEDPTAAFHYVMASTNGADWDWGVRDGLPHEEQIQHLRDYFASHALAVEGN